MVELVKIEVIVGYRDLFLRVIDIVCLKKLLKAAPDSMDTMEVNVHSPVPWK